MFICVGPALEELLGHFSFLVLYLGGAASSALVWMVFSGGPAVDPHLMGASGAIFAVIAGLGAAGGGHKVLTFMFVLPFRMRADVLAVLAFIFEIIALPSRSPVAHTAHLGGAAFGFLYILIFHYILGPPPHRILAISRFLRLASSLCSTPAVLFRPPREISLRPFSASPEKPATIHSSKYSSMSSKKKMFMNTRLSRWNDSITGINTHRNRGHAKHNGARISNTVIPAAPPSA